MASNVLLQTSSMGTIELLQLPHEILEKILSYLTFDEISSIRQTCHKFDTMSSSVLNLGFSKANRLYSTIQREVKAKLPRRESERRNHPLARHVDILSAIETRLSLLSMTYSKYIELGVCCFIPGKVLDEVYSVLKCIRTNANPPRAHELLQELRDISSMAMEHFDEKIAPQLRNRIPLSPELRLILHSANTSAVSSSAVPVKTRGVLGNFARKQSSVPHMSCHLHLLRDVRKQLRQTRSEMRHQIAVRNTQISDLSRKVSEHESTISELNRRVVEFDQRFDDMMAEIARVRSTEEVHMKPTDGKSQPRSSKTCVVETVTKQPVVPLPAAVDSCKVVVKRLKSQKRTE